jgi:predicted Rossmann fold flavoprotein
MFPETNRSETIVNCLETLIARHHIDRMTLTMVAQITPLDRGFSLKTRQGEEYRCRYLCIATGGSPAGHKLAQDLGLTLVPPVPSLFTFQVDDPLLHQRAGIALGPPLTPSLTLSVKSDEFTNKPLREFHQMGTVLITHWGLSGPGVLKLSAFAAPELFAADYKALLTINWLYPQSLQAIYQKLTELKRSLGKKQVTNINPFPFARSFWDLILEKQQIPTHKNLADLSHDELTRMAGGLTQDRFQVSGKGVFKEEFVTAGGVSCDEINFKTMATKKLPRLYCVGEVVNIDGVTGGFNFQNAWTTGYLAGSDLAKRLGEDLGSS